MMKFEDDDDKDDDDDIGPVTCIHDIRNKCKKQLVKAVRTKQRLVIKVDMEWRSV